MRWTTSDPRTAGRGGQPGETVRFVSAGAYTELQKVGTSPTDWAAYDNVVPTSPMAGCPTAATDPRTAGRAGSVDEVVLYYTAGTGIYLIKYGAADTEWVPMPTLQSSGAAFGSGTTNKVAKWTRSTTIGDSSITDTGALVSVASALTVTGATTLQPLTLGSIVFSGVGGLISQDNANFFWDDTNNRLGVGTNSPSHIVDFRGSVAADIGRVQNNSAAGYATIGYYSNAGTGKGFLGYGNASVADTTVGGFNYWRSDGSSFVISAGAGAISTAAMYIHGSNGNVNIGTTVGDPSTKLRVQGSTVLGSSTADTHTISGNTTITGDSFLGLRVKTATQANVRATGGALAAYTGFVVEKDSGATELWFIGRNGVDNTDGLIFLRGGNKYLEIDASGNGTFLNALVLTAGLRQSSSSGPLWKSGAGTPEGAVTAPVGSLFTRTDGGAGTTLYVKESGAGSVGWIAK